MTAAYGVVADATDTRVEDGGDTTAMELADSLSDKEVVEEFARAYDLDPDDVVMMGEDGIEVIGDFININWPGIPSSLQTLTGYNAPSSCPPSARPGSCHSIPYP